MTQGLRSSMALMLWLGICMGFSDANAQAPLSVRGTVVDSSGAAVPNVTVRLEDAAGATVSETHADAKGGFSLPNLHAGEYHVVVPEATGFATTSLPLHLAAPVAGLRITLLLAAVTESITVGNEAALTTDSASNKDTVSVTGDSLGKLPVFDQNYVSTLSAFLDAGSAGSGPATVIVDGVEMKSAGVSPSAIQEVRINNDPYSAEFTRPGRGRIEIITKPGSPEFHGEFNFLFRDAALNATNYFAVVKPPEQRRIYEGHLTGPVGHGGHTTFILSGARREEDLAAAVHAVGPNGAIDYNVATPNRDSQIALRGTRDFSPNHRLSVQYNYDYSTVVNDQVGGLTLREAGLNNDGREDDLVINDRIIVSSNLVHQLQVTFEKDEETAHSVTNAAALLVDGAFIGGGAQADVERSENTVHISEVVSWNHKNHYIRFGANIPQISRRAVDDRTNRLGTFGFNSLSDFNANRPYVFTAQQGPGRGLYWINELGAFVQDQYKVSAKLQLSLGLRYDWQTYVSDNNNFSPRVSAAYSINDKTILRTGVGVFYDRTGGDFPATVKLHNGVVLRTLQIDNPGYPLAVAPGASFAALPTNLVRFDSHVRAPYTYQYSFGIERQVHKGLTVTAGYRGGVQAKSFRSRDVNAPLFPDDPNPVIAFARPDSAFGQIQQIESGGRTLQNSFDVAMRGHAGRVFSGQAQYTVARVENNTNGIRGFPQDQYRPNAEWARANYDRLQKFNLLGNINPEHWLTLGVAAQLYAGTPYTELAGSDTFHTGLGNARPAGVGRNTLTAGGTANLDLSWEHEFHLTKAKGDDAKVASVQISGFNVLNRTNFTDYVGNGQSTFFERPTAALAARQIQFEFGYKF